MHTRASLRFQEGIETRQLALLWSCHQSRGRKHAVGIFLPDTEISIGFTMSFRANSSAVIPEWTGTFTTTTGNDITLSKHSQLSLSCEKFNNYKKNKTFFSPKQSNSCSLNTFTDFSPDWFLMYELAVLPQNFAMKGFAPSAVSGGRRQLQTQNNPKWLVFFGD